MKAIVQSLRQASTWVVGCLVVATLTAGLGLLQSHWVWELSEREREILLTHLSADALGFSEDFDRELTQIYTSMQLDPEAVARHDGRAIAARYGLWARQARYTRLVRGLWLAEPGDDGSAAAPSGPWRLWRLDGRQSLVPAEGPAAWRELNSTGPLLSPLDEETLALFIPVVSPAQVAQPVPATGSGAFIATGARLVMRYVIIQLDRQCITDELLPDLTRRYFRGSPRGRELEYRVVVVRDKMPHEVIYDSGLGSSSSVMPDSADATASLFGIRRNFGAGIHGVAPQLSKVRASAVAAPVRTQLSFARAIDFATPEAWQLRVTHRSGSLEALAVRTRWQNLILGLTMLVLLVGTVVLLLLTARRMSVLARRQTQFVAGVSHELRTPMAVIGMAAANLADGVVSDSSQVRCYGTIIQEEGRRLARTVEQVLRYARVEASNLPPREPTQVNTLVRGVLKSLQAEITALGFICTSQLAESLPAVLVDRFSMECVLHNLLTNALKYSVEQREIIVRTGMEESRAGVRVWIEVQDRGIGIEPVERAAIFEPFRRGRAAIERKLPGSGLGLCLVQRIVQCHEGTVRVRSEVGKGSAFTVSLPAATHTLAAEPAAGQL